MFIGSGISTGTCQAQTGRTGRNPAKKLVASPPGGASPSRRPPAPQMSDEADAEGDAEGISRFVGERDDSGRFHGNGSAVFAQTYTKYDGLWDNGRPAGNGRFTFLGGRRIDLKLERPTAPDFMKSPSTLGPGFIWPQDDGKGRRELVISGLTYTCSTEPSGVCLNAEATAARERGLPHCILAESVISGRCQGQGRLTWALANGSIVSYEGQLQGTATCLALMHGHVSFARFQPVPHARTPLSFPTGSCRAQ